MTTICYSGICNRLTSTTIGNDKLPIVSETKYYANDRAIWQIERRFAWDKTQNPPAPDPGIITETGYDNLGRVTWSSDGFGNKTHTRYDDRGLTVQTASPGTPLPLVTRTVYDKQGRAEWTLDAVPASADATTITGLASRTIYDAAGRVERTERRANVVVTLTPTGSGQYATEITPGSEGTLRSQTLTHYDEFGQVDWSLDAAGAKTETTYDKLGRATLVTVSGPDIASMTTQTHYHLAGRVDWTIVTDSILDRVHP